jgi:hypothetical protein
MYDPMAGKDTKVTSIMKQLDENNIFFEMFGSYEGKEFKMMEMTYTR